MTPEQQGILIDEVESMLVESAPMKLPDCTFVAEYVVAQLQSKYRLTPIEDKQQEGTGT